MIYISDNKKIWKKYIISTVKEIHFQDTLLTEHIADMIYSFLIDDIIRKLKKLKIHYRFTNNIDITQHKLFVGEQSFETMTMQKIIDEKLSKITEEPSIKEYISKLT
ncbi:MAG: hypothetical protein ACOCQD_01895 [archaeon]